MKKILAFSGSNSSQSINQKLVHYTSKMASSTRVEVVDLRDFELPLFGVDLEKANGIHPAASALRERMDEADGFLISTPEYNSGVPSFLKNSIDWISRTGKAAFQNKPVALMATSPGKGGAARALQQLHTILSGFMAGNVLGTVSVPQFHQNTVLNDEGSIDSISNAAIVQELQDLVQLLEQEVKGQA